MKFCPICKTRYDEEILRFCIKDGSPLVDEDQPNFTALPSESDFGEETIIRRKNPTPVPTSPPEPDTGYVPAPRIVIPTSEVPPREPVRTKTSASIRRPPPKSNTTKTVLLTVLGTIVLLVGAGGIFWFLSNQNSGKANRNANYNYNTNFNSIDINLNTNLNVDNSLANFNYNLNANANPNSKANAVNANLKTPTPTRTPTPTQTSTPNTNVNTNVIANGATNINSNSNARPPVNTTPTAVPTPSTAPRPSPSAPTNRPVNAGILNGRAVNLPKPAYPPIAKQMRATGQVAVQVQVDESGNVTSAKAMSGNLLLRASAEAAARQSRFNPVRIGDQAVKATGVVLYNFTN